MFHRSYRLFVVLALGATLTFSMRAAGPATTTPWPALSRETRPWTRWWWPGSAVDHASLTHQLEQFAQAGLGGVEITPIYGARGAEDRYIRYLSPRWMEMLAYTAREAHRLGLGVDIATGTGWPFGGPWITPAEASEKIVFRDGHLGGEPTGMKVKRAAPGGEGLVIDPYSPDALRHYLAPFSKAFAGFPRGLVRAQFHDSFEYYGASWTPRFPEIFREMHGYDLDRFGAELMGKKPLDADTLGRLKSDYRETLARLHHDYIRAWVDWSHAHGFLVRNQSHGAPANLLDLYGTVDIPETEVFGSTPFPIPRLRRNPADVRAGDDLPESLVIRMASSAAHVMGHPRASSETCTWLREHWKVTLSDTKPEIDRLFLNGINHIFYHGTVFSPEDAAWPGWFFYASTQFNPNNPWWGDFGALNTYVARVQSVLQSGQPDNDVLLYWPFADALDDPHGLMRQFTVHDVGWLRDSPTGRLATRLSAAGYSYDYISDAQLLQTKASGGELATPGHRYRVLIVPTTRRMPVETLQRLITLARGGATVIFEGLPEDVPGYGRLAERRAQFTALLAAPELRNAVVQTTEPTASETTAPDDRHESGARAVAVSAAAADLGVADRAAKSSPLLARLHALGVPRESVVETGLGFIRRASENGHDYFFANLTADDFDGWVTLGTAAGSAALLDPLTGRFGAAALRHTPDGRAQIYLQLASGQSMLLRTQTSAAASVAPRAWTYVKPAAAPGAPFTLAGTWRVTFLRGGPVLPPPFETRVLKSWTELDGPETQRFAGTARYRLEFDLPAAPVADDWLLDLGDVRESARVRLNGTEIATAWSLPFRLRVGAQLQPGRNVLELDVTNLAANRIRDLDRRHVPWKIMREIDIVNIHYQPFDASAWPLTPSGLLGPVTLAPLRTFHPQPATPNHHP